MDSSINIDFEQLIAISEGYNQFLFLHSSQLGQNQGQEFDWICGLGAFSDFRVDKNDIYSPDLLDQFLLQNSTFWKMVYVSYDFKNRQVKQSASHIDNLNFSELYLFVPEIVVYSKKNKYFINIQNQNSVEKFENLISKITQSDYIKPPKLNFNQRILKEAYLQQIETIKSHLKYGDIYELNFCQEFHTECHSLEPRSVYSNLIQTNPAPFSAFLKDQQQYLMSSSPERFLKKSGQKIYSQPIKGTVRRGKDKDEDQNLKHALKSNLKERAENIMIVDLVRNDLSRIEGIKDVKVDELCEIYTFEHVHQMISTVSGTLPVASKFSEILSTCFPMGSMTGAPKTRAMQLIEKYESQSRSLFSGTVGYINPEGDFDLNVVIRSILYNKENHYVSISAGGAITYKSDPSQEYEESLLKASALLKTFE